MSDDNPDSQNDPTACEQDFLEIYRQLPPDRQGWAELVAAALLRATPAQRQRFAVLCDAAPLEFNAIDRWMLDVLGEE